MFVEITNDPRPYAWGSDAAIADLLGRERSGGPEAELWLGAHPGSPSRIVDPRATGGSADLAEWVARDPGAVLGEGSDGRLPFLLKLLAAASPLSLQAHPNPEQARAGFAREEALGVPHDAPTRSYRDDSAKPELIVALRDGFDALCGFRDPAAARELFAAIADGAAAKGGRAEAAAFEPLLARLDGTDPLRNAFEWLSGEGSALVHAVCTVAERAKGTAADRVEFETVRSLAAEYPGDPGIAISLLLNRVRLAAGEALFLPAGNIHAYLGGLGVELMSSSDNVLRGGLTPKHVDVAELMSVLVFEPLPVPYLVPSSPAAGLSVFDPEGVELALARLTGEAVEATLRPVGAAILLCTAGAFTVSGAGAERAIERGQSLLATPEEGALTLSGTGDLFVASSALTGVHR